MCFLGSSAPPLLSSSSPFRFVHEYVANDRADFAFASGVGGENAGNGNKVTVASEYDNAYKKGVL
jgi:hypothetical protein